METEPPGGLRVCSSRKQRCWYHFTHYHISFDIRALVKLVKDITIAPDYAELVPPAIDDVADWATCDVRSIGLNMSIEWLWVDELGSKRFVRCIGHGFPKTGSYLTGVLLLRLKNSSNQLL
jgi:hypothetical protein